MQFTGRYASPLGGILLAADDIGLTGLWFEGQKYFAQTLDAAHEERELPLLDDARRWLDQYFSGRAPDFTLPVHLTGTAFQCEVWDILCAIPYGRTTTYGAIAAQLAKRRGLASMSAQAVGSAVGHNPVSIIVPCHRVVGTHGSLTGYAGGVDRKRSLLMLEGADIMAKR
ncbi:MAG: methylated-DNA--[protein]-cysteine S-methyltransferase [Candidatus Ventricola sp.]